MLNTPATFLGVNHRGQSRSGSTLDPATFVEEKFNEGWRSLTVTHEGRILGETYKSAKPPHERAWYVR
jgi:hypothetical protein